MVDEGAGQREEQTPQSQDDGCSGCLAVILFVWIVCMHFWSLEIEDRVERLEQRTYIQADESWGPEWSLLCDEPGCGERITCGWSSPSGYRKTCSTHYRQHNLKEDR
jgi:hypothetical protein